MRFAEYINRVKAKLADGAPGETFQLRMAPVHRLPAADYLRQGLDYRLAAVMILLVPHSVSGEPSVLLIERSVYDGAHSGQIALPGGKPEKDEQLDAAALRELQEETGISLHQPELLGTLTPLYIPPSRFLVHPFLSALDHIPPLIPQEREVQRIFTLPVEALNPENSREEEFETSEGFKVKAPFYPLDNGLRLWGATAMMLSELYELHRI